MSPFLETLYNVARSIGVIFDKKDSHLNRFTLGALGRHRIARCHRLTNSFQVLSCSVNICNPADARVPQILASKDRHTVVVPLAEIGVNAPTGKVPGSHTFSKVPEVTLGFWIIKILATTLGETLGDTVTMTWLEADVMANSGYLIGSAI